MEIKQVVITGQSEAELQTDCLNIENLEPNQVLIETEYTYISTGTELANYSGKEPKVFQPGQWCTYPWKSLASLAELNIFYREYVRKHTNSYKTHNRTTKAVRPSLTIS